MSRVGRAIPRVALAAGATLGFGVAGYYGGEFVHEFEVFQYDEHINREACASPMFVEGYSMPENCGKLLIEAYGVLEPNPFMDSGEEDGVAFIVDKDHYTLGESIAEIQAQTTQAAVEAREQRSKFHKAGIFAGIGALVLGYGIYTKRPEMRRTRHAFRAAGEKMGLIDKPMPPEVVTPPYDQGPNVVEQEVPVGNPT